MSLDYSLMQLVLSPEAVDIFSESSIEPKLVLIMSFNINSISHREILNELFCRAKFQRRTEQNSRANIIRKQLL